MIKPLMQDKDAAHYTGVSVGYLKNQAKLGHVAYVLTSPKKIMFEKDDLDRWVATWRKVEVTTRYGQSGTEL